MWQTIIKYSQPFLIFCTGIALFFWSRLSTLLPLRLTQVLGITISLLAGVIFYFDKNITSLLSKPKYGDHLNLAESIKEALAFTKEPKKVRIYAFSTYMIQSIFSSLGGRVGECSIVVYASDLDEENLRHIPYKDWEFLMRDGRVKQLKMHVTSIYPLEYYIIFDDRALIMGHYLIEDSRFPRSEVQEPIFIKDTTEYGKLSIRKYLEAFDHVEESQTVQRLI